MLVRYFTAAVLITFLFVISAYGLTTFGKAKNVQCGNIFSNDKFILTSENYPSPYPQDKECFYLLQGRNCTIQFNINFLDFDVKNTVGCTKDRLEIGHQGALCGTAIGSKTYASEKGSLKLKFISDDEIGKINRGFRILVTRIDACGLDNSGVTTQATQVEWTSNKPVLAPSVFPSVKQQCCPNNSFALKRFYLVSPNFPYSTNTPVDCIYVIKKARSQVCRMRINILFFSLGPAIQTSCPYGHLEIDGKKICGCNSNLKLTTDFRDMESKVLKYHSSGYNANGFYGFVLEVIQDECPKKYSPDNGVFAERSFRNFRHYNDQDNKIAWPRNSNIGQLKLVDENIQWYPPENNRQVTEFGNIYKHFYFFAPEEENDISITQSVQEREESNYIEISTINTMLTNSYNYQQCVQWNGNQMVILKRRFGNSLHQMCKSFQENNIDVKKCLVLNALNGNIRSPGYPLLYPLSQDICYRFQMLPGYCEVKLYFNDFQLEKSYECLKDYLAINQYRYCGNYLINKQVTINSQGKPHQDLNFITDANYCGKGFSAVYQQVSCQKPNYPITPNNFDPDMETTEIPLDDCNKIIRDTYFIIRNEAKSRFCSFNIKKVSDTVDSCNYQRPFRYIANLDRPVYQIRGVCKIRLYFERFNLVCDSEYITIDGNVYCGEMSGHILTIDIPQETTVIYKRDSSFVNVDYNGDFRIRGTQITNDCERPTPEPARLTLRNSKASKVFPTNNGDIKTYPSYYPDVCELMKNNVTLEELPNKICELLTKNHNVPDCTFSNAHIEDLSTNQRNTTKIRLTSDKTENLNYKLIECQN